MTLHSSVQPRLAHSLPPVYAAAAVRLLMPLFVLPLVAARLGADEFGRLSFVLVWAALLSTLVEGGFLAAATRLAVNADAPRRWQIAQQVFTARCVLCLPTALLAIVAARFAGHGSSHPWIDALAIAALACALGWPATWYLQATQQLNRWARVELVVYALMLVGFWFFARSVEAYLAMQFVGSVALAWLGWRWLQRDHANARHAALWSRLQLKEGLRLGGAMLPVSIAGAAYSYALPAAASVQMSKADLGLYFMADRIVRAVMNAADPVFSVVYPRIVTRFASGARAALRYAMAWAFGGVLAGLAMFAVGCALWPVMEPLIVSRTEAIDLLDLRSTLFILGWLLPLLLGWKFIGYWMLGSGRFDTAYRACMIVGGIAGTLAAATIGGAAGPSGLAWTAICVEALVIVVAVAGMALTRFGQLPTSA